MQSSFSNEVHAHIWTPEELAQLYSLIRIYGFSYEIIGELLNIDKSTVRARIRDNRHKDAALQEAIEDYDQKGATQQVLDKLLVLATRRQKHEEIEQQRFYANSSETLKMVLDDQAERYSTYRQASLQHATELMELMKELVRHSHNQQLQQQLEQQTKAHAQQLQQMQNNFQQLLQQVQQQTQKQEQQDQLIKQLMKQLQQTKDGVYDKTC